jgi:hypothetical protein
MKVHTSLTITKIVHTLVWTFFNIVIFYLFFAVLYNQIDKWIWIGFSLISLEGIVLVCFKNKCPLTLVARKYSDSTKDNFDIYLPEWLARYNKLIYISFLAVIVLLLIYRLLTNK